MRFARIDFHDADAHRPLYRTVHSRRSYSTRITPARRRILEKMRFDREFGDAAKPYWVRRGRGASQRGAPIHRKASSGLLVSAAHAGRRPCVSREPADAGFGSRRLQGRKHRRWRDIRRSSARGVDASAADDASIWRFVEDQASPSRPNMIPERAFAVAAVAHCPNLCAFHPRNRPSPTRRNIRPSGRVCGVSVRPALPLERVRQLVRVASQEGFAAY